ncbi:MAG: trehalose-phosphatase [Candidatus Omnitrophica bacterium]|nr:trehalose-phosphatase [Candidatus Omnitrophota bacterium]
MKHLFEDWQKIIEQFSGRNIFTMLDYDGTLAPIAETPEEAVIPEETKKTLLRLTKNRKFKVAIVSGRSLKDIKDKVGLEEIIYVGNHGLEIDGPKIKFSSPISLKHRDILRKSKEELAKNLSSIEGVIFEDKMFSLGVHFRMVSEEKVPLVKRIFGETMAPFLAKGKIKVRPAKKALEIRLPVEWNKGRIALWLLAREEFARSGINFLPVYIGDDSTDEDAFLALKKSGLTIFVGESKISQAKYFLKDTKEVGNFLKEILEISGRSNDGGIN